MSTDLPDLPDLAPAPSPEAVSTVASLAQDTSTVSGYARALGSRLWAGQSGVLPVIVGLVLIAIIFQSQDSKFLSAGNMVNLLVQGSAFMVIGMGQVFVLILGEIDLSLGFVAGIAAVIMTQLVLIGTDWPWPLAILAALGVATILGFVQGFLITRLRLPSFVVTLAGLLGFQGVMIQLLGTGGNIPINSPTIISFANGTLSPTSGWIATIVAIALFAAVTIARDIRRRRKGGKVAPAAITALKIGGIALIGIVLVIICNTDRGFRGIALSGMPWVVPIVLGVLLVWSFVLGRTRFGRYLYAIGGNAEAARRAGIRLRRIRTLAFALAGLTAGIGGILYASRLSSISTSYEGGTIVLYVVATAVIGGTSLFGGRGHPLHAILGGLVIAGIVNGMGLLGLSAAVQLMATALVLLASITVDVVVRRRGETSR
jgi:D-xylose transport system permease protein